MSKCSNRVIGSWLMRIVYTMEGACVSKMMLATSVRLLRHGRIRGTRKPWGAWMDISGARMWLLMARSARSDLPLLKISRHGPQQGVVPEGKRCGRRNRTSNRDGLRHAGLYTSL